MYDKLSIEVRAGDGGNGAVSFRHEKFVPFGGPDGGDGGNGANIVSRADGSLDDLFKYNRKRMLKAENGRNAAGRKRHGRNGKDLVADDVEPRHGHRDNAQRCHKPGHASGVCHVLRG